jgi:dienelactone hydrolase
MSVAVREAKYSIGPDVFDGAWITDDARSGRQPVVLVFHGWEGRSQAQEKVAEQLVGMGYAGFACDVFGNGIRGDMSADNSQLIAPFLNDRALLRRRLIGTVDAIRARPFVDPDRIAAIGFCFGGLCVLDLARAGVDIRGVASFHGMFDKPHGLPALTIKAKVSRRSRTRERAHRRAGRLAIAGFRSHDARVHGGRCESTSSRDSIQRTLG